MPHTQFLKIKNSLMDGHITPNKFLGSNGENFIFIWLPTANDSKLLEIRNAEHVLKEIKNSLPIALDTHKRFKINYPLIDRLDFICLHELSGDYIGGINIAKTRHGYEMGKYIGNQKYLGLGLAYSMSCSFIEYIKVNIGHLEEIKAVTKITNIKNINLNFKLGFRIVKLVDDNYWLMSLR